MGNSDVIGGQTEGISKFWLEQIEALYQQEVPRTQLFSEELAQRMADITASINSEVAVYLDRHGRVFHVQVGDQHSVGLANLQKRQGRSRLSGLRCIHTHPGGNGTLSLVDVTALPQMRFDAMVALGVDCQKGQAVLTNVGLAWGVLGSGQVEPLLCPSIGQALTIDFINTINEIEKAAGKEVLLVEENVTPRALLVAITGKETEAMAQYSLKELADLAETAGLEVIDNVYQRRVTPEVATYIGKGKANELRFLCQIMDIQSLVFDGELSPVQIRNLEETTGRAIIDRSMLILDIFAQRAKSNEGKLQVELAQLKYMMPRLTGQGEVLSRLGGGIGTRGPGETKLEVDKRVIRKRINELEGRLEQVVKTRRLHRSQRADQQTPMVALVGYTNAGKSTLLNVLTDAGVLAEDKLFATLDTTTRKVLLPSGRPILLTDTVGFIRKLPHHLVAAFRATLEEVVEADLLLHVIDCSAEEMTEQVTAVHQVLESLGCAEKPTIAVLNKADLVDSEAVIKRLSGRFDQAVAISAKQRQGLDGLMRAITEILPMTDREIRLVLPYSAGSYLSMIHQQGKLYHEEYQEDGVAVHALVPATVYQALEKAGLVEK